MIDIHTHLIPGLDDGSPDMKTSLEQLSKAAKAGVKRVYLTSHYFKGHYEYSREEYDTRYKELVTELDKTGVKLELRPGFEVFTQSGIIEDIVAKSLYLGDSKYVLLESELNGLPPDFYTCVYPILRAGLKPILAHAERYVSIMNKPTEARSLIEKNIYIQVNASSLVGLYGDKVKNTAKALIENGWVHFVASDNHGRTPVESYLDAHTLISSKVDQRTADLLMKDFPSRIESNEHIPYRYVDVIRPHHHRRKRRSWFKRLLRYL